MSLEICLPCELKTNNQIQTVLNDSKISSQNCLRESYLLLSHCSICHLMPETNQDLNAIDSLGSFSSKNNQKKIREIFAEILFGKNVVKIDDFYSCLNSKEKMHNSSFETLSSYFNNNYNLIELLQDIKIKSKELLETEAAVAQNTLLIKENKNKIQELEQNLLKLERESNDNEKNDLKMMLNYPRNNNLSNVNDYQRNYEQMFISDFNYPVAFNSGNNTNTNLKKEINRLKYEIDGLKFDNSKLVFKTNTLDSHLNELQQEISHSIQKTEYMRRLALEDDRNFNELNRLLNDIRSTKLLLRKSNGFPSNDLPDYFKNSFSPLTASLYTQPHVTKKHDFNFDAMLSTFNFSKNFNESDKKFNQKLSSKSTNVLDYPDNKKSFNNDEQKAKLDTNLDSQSFVTTSKNFDIIIDDKEKTLTKSELNKTREDLNRIKAENRELTKKIFEIEKNAIEKRKHADIWQTLFNKILLFLPEKEAKLLRVSTEFEKISSLSEPKQIPTHEIDNILKNVIEVRKIDQEATRKEKDTMREIIDKLTFDNRTLSTQLNQLKELNANELQKLNDFSAENSKLKREIGNYRKVHMDESNKTLSEHQFKSELENLKTKLDFEMNEKETLKKKFESEMNAAKIRFDAEIIRQNQLMQTKYDNFTQEINTLNKIVKDLKDEKRNLLATLEREKNLNREIMDNPKYRELIMDKESNQKGAQSIKFESSSKINFNHPSTESANSMLLSPILSRGNATCNNEKTKQNDDNQSNVLSSYSTNTSSTNSTSSSQSLTYSFTTLPWTPYEKAKVNEKDVRNDSIASEETIVHMGQ